MAQINPLAAQNEGDVRTRGILRGAATADTGVGAVSDIAFSPDGKKIYIVAPTRNGEDTMFRVGTIGSKDIEWGAVFTICDLKMVALETTAADPTKVYGIAQKRGADKKARATASADRPGDPRGRDAARPRRRRLQRRRPLPSRPQRRGLGDRGAAGQAPTKYNAVRRIADVTGRAAATATIVPLSGLSRAGTTSPCSGTRTARPPTRSTPWPRPAAARSSCSGSRHDRDRADPLEQTALRLEVYPPTNALLVTSEDGFCVRVIDLKVHQKVVNFVPMQLGRSRSRRTRRATASSSSTT